jgi:glycosyltransferase involved in cell wall biosynthesis
MSPLRVVHLLPCLYRGGAEMAVRRLVLALGGGQRMVAPDGPGAALFDGILPRRAFRRIETDLLSGAASLRRALAAEAAAAPVDIVHVHGEAALLWFARRAMPGAARVYTSHGIVGAARAKAALTAWAVNRWAHAVTVASAHDAARLRAAGAQGVTVVANAVPPPEGGGDPALRAGAGVVAGTLARLEPEKGVDVLIRAAALAVRDVPALRVVVAGEGGQRAALARLIAESGAPVTLAGFHPAGAVLGALDVYVQPSRAEAFGMAAAEAMAAGLPVIASDVGGLPEVVGEAGVLVPPGDPAALAAALVRLARDPAARAAMGRAGAARAAGFAPAAVAQAMAAVYAAAAAARRQALP